MTTEQILRRRAAASASRRAADGRRRRSGRVRGPLERARIRAGHAVRHARATDRMTDGDDADQRSPAGEDQQPSAIYTGRIITLDTRHRSISRRVDRRARHDSSSGRERDRPVSQRPDRRRSAVPADQAVSLCGRAVSVRDSGRTARAGRRSARLRRARATRRNGLHRRSGSSFCSRCTRRPASPTSGSICFMATGLERGETAHEADEFMTVETVTLSPRAPVDPGGRDQATRRRRWRSCSPRDFAPGAERNSRGQRAAVSKRETETARPVSH